MSDRKKQSFFKEYRANNSKVQMAIELKALTDDERKARDNLLDKVLAGGCASTPCLPCSLSNGRNTNTKVVDGIYGEIPLGKDGKLPFNCSAAWPGL